MNKLCDLVTFENVLQTYDGMPPCSGQTLIHYGNFVNALVDDINLKLERLLTSKTKLSCRNALVASFDTMTKRSHWLQSRLFDDLPSPVSMELTKKCERMVDLLQALAIKVIQVDSDYAVRFFRRIKARYRMTRATDYDLWKARHHHRLTMQMLEEYQCKLTAKMLTLGIMAYDDEPSKAEMDEVKLDLLCLKLKHDQELPDNFKEECAKLKRYSGWAGNMFVIDYQQITNYLFPNFGKFTKDQHIALFEYDVQMKHIHDDMVKMNPDLARYLHEEPTPAEPALNLFAPAKALKVMLQQESWFKELRADKRYDHQWIEQFFDDLFASEYGEMLAQAWHRTKKHTSFKAGIVGCLHEAGVIKGNSNLSIASFIIPNDKGKANNYANFMGRGKRKPYAQWISDHVK